MDFDAPPGFGAPEDPNPPPPSSANPNLNPLEPAAPIRLGASLLPLCHAPNPKGSKAWERHLKVPVDFFFDNPIHINHIKYQH